MKRLLYCFCLMSFVLVCCKSDKSPEGKDTETKVAVQVPAFNGDSAYAFIEKQLSFGPRVPGSEGHKACKNWMVQKFESYGAVVIEQDFTARIYTGEGWPATNIIAQFNPGHGERIILSAHWDTRFIAEEDPDKDRRDDPIPGADDGGSGVAVLIEIARLISENPIDLGVDIILWDAEDQGKRGSNQPPELWCLGSQYWSRNKHTRNYRAKYGINLDMIGAKNPRFGKDEVSLKYADKLMNEVWALARRMGYSDMFVDVNTGILVDDHLFVNQIANIPMINIINQPNNLNQGISFVDHWHTHDDDISIIDKRTLRVVGQVVLKKTYSESE